MSNVTTQSTQTVEFSIEAHTNFMGGPSFDVTNPLSKLRMMAASCFFGEPQYYSDKSIKEKPNGINAPREKVANYLWNVLSGLVTPTSTGENTSDKVLEKVIDDALDFDIEGTLKIAALLRQEDMIRTTPQVIMVRAANHEKAKGTGLIRQYASAIIRRGDEPAVQMAYQLSKYGKVVPNSLKRAWKDVLSNLPERLLAKYRMENRDVKTIDVVRVSHASSPAISKLVKDELVLNQSTWESLISEKGSSKETWEEVIDNLWIKEEDGEIVKVNNYMALMRNLRNLTKAGVSTKHVEKVVNALAFEPAVKYSKQLPFRFYTAYSMVKNENSKYADALEKAMQVSVNNLPKFEGRVAALCDNSGSAHGQFTSNIGKVKVSDIANLTAVLTGMVTDGEAYVMPFGDTLKKVKVDPSRGVLEQASEVNDLGNTVGGGTETGIWTFWDRAIQKKEHWDHVFVYSDMQAGHGQLYTSGGKHAPTGFAWDDGYGGRHRSTYVDVPALIKAYREQVNPNVQVFLVQVGGYGDTIVPEIYDKTYILGGWSDAILKFAHKVSLLNP